MKRFDWEKRVVNSDLPANVRLLLLTLAVLADWPMGTTSQEHTPSLSKIADRTGLGRSTAARALKVAEETGWLERHRPPVADAWADKAKTTYKLTYGTSPGTGLVTEPTSPAAGLALVPERDQSLVPQRDTNQNHYPEPTRTGGSPAPRPPRPLSPSAPGNEPQPSLQPDQHPSPDLTAQLTTAREARATLARRPRTA